jgi:hypothetical protein
MREKFDSQKYEDIALLAVLDALVADFKTGGARDLLEVNHRTFANCRDSRKVTPLMRRKLRGVVGWGPVDDAPVPDDKQEDIDRTHNEPEGPDEALVRAVGELDAENSQLRETIETQAAHIEDLGRRLGFLGQKRHIGGMRGWLPWNKPIKRAEVETVSFMEPPMPGMVTLEPRLGEERELGQAAPLVSEWRKVYWQAITSEDQLERASAKLRQLELELELIEDFHLNLPPYKESRDTVGENNQSFDRRAEKVKAVADLVKAERKQSRRGG